MRKYLFLLAALASLCVIGGAGAATASAANCSNIYTTQIIANGWVQYTGYVGGCSDVDLVEQSAQVGSNKAWIYDYATASGHFVSTPPTLSDTLCGRQYTTYTDLCGQNYFVAPWCGGGITHLEYSTFYFRIHSKSQGTWGPWHVFASNNVQSPCHG